MKNPTTLEFLNALIDIEHHKSQEYHEKISQLKHENL